MDFVTLRKLAAQIGRHHTAVRADLRRRGYESARSAPSPASGRTRCRARTPTNGCASVSLK